MLHAQPATATAAKAPVPASGMLAAVTPERAALATFALVMGGVLATILSLTGGTFVFSHDDPYIHVAMAQRLLQGHYGINLGEVTSPSSSVIWPFLLMPAAATPLAVHFPLVLNTLFGGMTAWLLGRFATGLTMPEGWRATALVRIAIACLLVLACNLVGLAYTGLEHNLQVLIAVAVALALIDHARGTPLPTWALALAAFGPSVRYELFAVTAAVCLVLLIESRWRTLLLVGAASVVLPALLALFLLANGNHPLPNSVMTKLLPNAVVLQGGADGSAGAVQGPQAVQAPPNGLAFIQYAVHRLWTASFGGKLSLVGSLIILLWCWLSTTGTWRTVLLAAIVAGQLHLGAGQFGWFYRYEVYAIAFSGLIAMAALAQRAPKVVPWLVGLVAIAYLPPVLQTPAGAHNVYLQQYQMHRFVAEHWNKPFAVNDLGWVSIGLGRNAYVLDLWGLASNEAVRRKDKSADWLDDITRRNGAGLAMIYGSYFPRVPAGWQLVAELELAVPAVTVAEEKVAFYATAIGDKAEIAAKLAELARTLPPGARLVPH